MRTYKVLASYRTYVYAYVEAEDEDQAYEIARDMDGGDFERDNYHDLCDWSIDGVNLELSHDPHHADCPAFDGLGCRCSELQEVQA